MHRTQRIYPLSMALHHMKTNRITHTGMYAQTSSNITKCVHITPAIPRHSTPSHPARYTAAEAEAKRKIGLAELEILERQNAMPNSQLRIIAEAQKEVRGSVHGRARAAFSSLYTCRS